MSDTEQSETAESVAWLHEPGSYIKSFPRRPDTDFIFGADEMPTKLPVMPDTSFYFERVSGRLPSDVLEFTDTRDILHCGVAVTEMVLTDGLLDPRDARTGANEARLRRLLGNIDMQDCRFPSPAASAEAGMLAGILARTQLGLAKPKKNLSAVELGCQERRRRQILFDALMFLTAYEAGAILISANITDMDLLLRFRPDARVLLYRQVRT